MSDLARLPAPLLETWEWQQDGACSDQDPALFFHPEGERGPRRDDRERAAKALCTGCVVRPACRDHALAVREPYGVWGGLSTRERDLLVAGA